MMELMSCALRTELNNGRTVQSIIGKKACKLYLPGVPCKYVCSYLFLFSTGATRGEGRGVRIGGGEKGGERRERRKGGGKMFLKGDEKNEGSCKKDGKS